MQRRHARAAAIGGIVAEEGDAAGFGVFTETVVPEADGQGGPTGGEAGIEAGKPEIRAGAEREQALAQVGSILATEFRTMTRS